MIRLVLFIVVFPLVAGCGSARSEGEVERAKQTVVVVLNSWKENDPPGKLKSLPEPVEFADDLRTTHTLTGYTLGNVDTSDKAVIRVAVVLKLKDKKGKESERETVYTVALKSPMIVSRDPYF